MAHAGQPSRVSLPLLLENLLRCLGVVRQPRLKLSPNYLRSLKEAELVFRGPCKRAYTDVSTEEEDHERLDKQIIVRVCQLHLISWSFLEDYRFSSY